MKSKEAYQKFLTIVNRNATNNRVNVDKGRFVLLFNTESLGFCRNRLDKRNEDSIRDIQALLVAEAPLSLKSKKEEAYTSFELPKDYFDFANMYAIAKKDCCEEIKIKVNEVKSEDKEEREEDAHNRPSFEWRETHAFLSENSVLIFKTDFEITGANLTYYRYPVKIDVEGYKKADGTASSDIDPEFDDKVVEEILLLSAKAFAGNNGDNQDYSLNKDRLFNT